MATEEQTQYDSARSLYSTSWNRVGQKLTIPNRRVTKLGFWLKKTLFPGGNVTFTVRKVSDDGIILTKVWGDVSALTGSTVYEEVVFDAPAVVNEEVRILCEFSGGSGGNACVVSFQISDVKGSEYQTERTSSPPYTDRTTWDCAYRYTYEEVDSDETVTASIGLVATQEKTFSLSKVFSTAMGLAGRVSTGVRGVLSVAIGLAPSVRRGVTKELKAQLGISPQEPISLFGVGRTLTTSLSVALFRSDIYNYIREVVTSLGLSSVCSTTLAFVRKLSSSISHGLGLHWSPRMEGFSAAVGLLPRLHWSPRSEEFITSLGLKGKQKHYKPRGFSPIFEYLDGDDEEDDDWCLEQNTYTLLLSDTLRGRTRTLEVEIANPEHRREREYFLYQPVRIYDQRSKLIVWYGRIELIEPVGAALRLTAKDGTAELAERRVDALEGGPFTRRSDLIYAIIEQNTSDWSFNLSGIEDSVITGIFDREYSKNQEGPAVLSEVQRIAEEDPWDSGDPPAGYGYDFYVDYVNGRYPRKFFYFKRGSKPAAPVSTNGLTLKFRGTSSSREKPILSDYSFVKEGSGIRTCIRVHYLLDGVWTYEEAVDEDLEFELRRRKLMVIRRPQITTAVEASNLAEAILHKTARSNIQRGKLSFVGFPILFKGGVWSLVRAGHMVYVEGLTDLPAVNENDMLLTSTRYSWPANVTECELLVSTTRGVDYSVYDTESYIKSQQDSIADLQATDTAFERIVYLKVIAESTALSTGDGMMYFTIPDNLNGMNLVDADAAVYTVSSSGTPTVQIHNATDNQDMLSTPITINANEFTSYTAAVAPVIDTNYDDVVVGNRLRIDVDVTGTGTVGLDVILTFRVV